MVDLIVVDVSKVSFKSILPSLPKFLKRHGYLLYLIKPQYERIKDADKLFYNFKKIASELSLQILGFKPLRLKGKEGAQEYWVLSAIDK